MEIKRLLFASLCAAAVLFVIDFSGCFMKDMASRSHMSLWNSTSFQQVFNANVNDGIQRVHDGIQQFSTIKDYEFVSQKRLNGILSQHTQINPSNQSNIATCNPHECLVFLKTHKTGGSTITSILNRYADIQELKMLIPPVGMFRFNYPRLFKARYIDLNSRKANFLVNHARYNHAEMNRVMAGRPKYITILREPISHFESSYEYFNFDKDILMETFLENPGKYFSLLGYQAFLIHNGMFFDLGYKNIHTKTKNQTRDILKKLHEEIHVVLIQEYFDESLVVLAKELCWDLDDVVYISQNARVSRKSSLTSAQVKKIHEYNWADKMLYEFFNRTLWERIAKYGSSFWADLRVYKNYQKQLNDACALKETTHFAHMSRTKVKAFKMRIENVERLHQHFCEKSLKSEVDYVNYFRRKYSLNLS